MTRPLHVLAIEPYMTGSHASFLEGLKRHSRHRIEVLGMPGRKWKWRMRAGAVSFASEIGRRNDLPDLFFVSDFLDVATFHSLLPERFWLVPILTYFHENQLTYPVQEEAERDYQFVFTNLTTCLASGRVLFNSRYHREEFLGAVPDFLKRMPDQAPEGIAEAIRAKSAVQHLGIEPDLTAASAGARPSEGPRIVAWNHRWEYDKNPELFFETLMRLDSKGIDFRLVVLGESFRQSPKIFQIARERLAHKILHFGYAETRRDYWRLLGQSHILVSTAFHEFFGLAVLEGIAAGCFPLLPHRLAYPELLPLTLHADCLFRSDEDFERRLEDLLTLPIPGIQPRLDAVAKTFEWQRRIADFDREFETLGTRRRASRGCGL